MKSIKFEAGFGSTLAAGLISTVIGGLIILYFTNKNAFNPTSKDNVANKTFDSLYQGATGSTQEAGSDFYDATHNADGSVKIWASPLWLLDKVSGLPTNGVSGF